MPVYYATKLPNKIASCQLWWDADDMATLNAGGIIADATAITTWKDKINGVVLTGTGTFKTSIQNGKNCLLMNGTSDMFKGTNISQLAGTTRTSFIVFKNTDLTDFRFSLYATKNDGSSPFANGVFAYYFFAGADYRYNETDSAGTIRYTFNSSSTDTTSFHLMSSRVAGTTNLLKQSDFDNTVNKVTGVGAVGIDITATNYLCVGDSLNSLTGAVDNNYHKGYIAEIIHFNTVLSLADYSAVRKYLQNKWGI